MSRASSASVLKVAELPPNRATAFLLEPGEDACRALASDLGLLDLRKLRFSGSVAAEGKTDWRLDGQLGATVVQPCVVTLDPVTTRIDEPVVRRFLAHLPDDIDGNSEIEMPEDDSIDRLGPEIDLAAIMAEALALALPLYPRITDASLTQAQFAEPGVTPMTDEDARPFAGLKSLRAKLGEDD